MFGGGRKDIVYDMMLTDYSEWSRLLDPGLLEVSRNQGVVDVVSSADIQLGREYVETRLLSPDMVVIVPYNALVQKGCENLNRQYHEDRCTCVTNPTISYMYDEILSYTSGFDHCATG